MNKKKKILLVSIVFLVCVAFTSHVSGAINELYTTSTADATWLSDIAEENSLLTPIAYLLLWLAGAVEYLLSSLANMLGTETAVMPWADAILFNAVPLLDPNFINPANGSITDILSGVLGKIYFTIFYLSVSFFSISVLLMAIKLAVSSIASERAKYKEAITNWIIGLVLLFSMHFLMSFCFYLNESLVTIASSIAREQTEQLNLTVDGSKAADTVIDDIDDVIIGWNNKDKSKEVFENNREILEQLCQAQVIKEVYNDGIIADHDTMYTLAAMVAFVSDYRSGGITSIEGVEAVSKGGTYKTDAGFMDLSADRRVEHNNLYEALFTAASSNGITLTGANYVSAIAPNADKDGFWSEIWTELGGEGEAKYSKREREIARLLVSLCNGSSIDYQNLGETPITQLANYFKLTCYNYDDESGGLVIDSINPISVLLYVIFVVQSLLYFFAYMKRLFYIIVLAMMAPIIVTYNFVMQI